MKPLKKGKNQIDIKYAQNFIIGVQHGNSMEKFLPTITSQPFDRVQQTK
jgi:hypothetical protein